MSSAREASDEDIIIHAGDLACYGCDRGYTGLNMKPAEILAEIPATVINIRGNHDEANKVKSLCSSMRLSLGKRFPNVSVSHWPSTSPHSVGQWLPGDVHLCGHVHKQWKHLLDVKSQVLNINIGADAWDFKLVSEEELMKYIDSVIRSSKIFFVDAASKK